MPYNKTFRRLCIVASSAMDRSIRAHEAAELIRAARNFHWVGLYDVTPTEIVAIAWTGANAPTFPRFPISQGLNGAAVTSRQNVVVQDVTKDSRYLTTFGSTRAEAIFVIASSINGRVVGTIDVESERTKAFTLDDETFLGRCAEVLKPLWLETKCLESVVKN